MLEKGIKLEKKVKRQISCYNIINTSKIWKKINESNMDSIINKIKNMQSKVNYSYHQLLNDNNNKDSYNKILNNSSEEIRDDKKKKTIDKISPIAKKFLQKAKNNINDLNKSTLEIVKLNYLYYLNKPTNNLNKSCDGKSTKKMNRAKSYINKNENNLLKNLNNKSLIKNFEYINNSYHKQMNNAFMKYKPTSHLNNMKILLEAVPSFREDILKVKDEVENDIKFKCDKYKFKNKYLNYMTKRTLLSLNKPKLKDTFKSKNNKNINEKICLPKIKLDDKNNKLSLPLLFINKLKRKKGQNFTILKQNKINEINKLISISGYINDLIEKDAIENKMKKYIEDYNNIKYVPENKIDLNKIDYFRNEKNTIDKKLESFYLNKYFNTIDQKEKNLYTKLNLELDSFTNRNLTNRDISLNELDSFLSKNDVNLLEQTYE